MTLIDTATAAKALGSSTRHVQKLVQAGKLTNKGSNWRISIDLGELAEKLEAGQISKGRSASR